MTGPRLTGFCNQSLPPESHARCSGTWRRGPAHDAEPCACSCHASTTNEPPVAGRVAGFYDDVPEHEYHGDRASLSVSGAKVLLRAPALYRWQLDHRVDRKSFDTGHAAHALVLGVGAPIAVIDADSWRTKAAQEERDAARARGETPLLAEDYQQVVNMADALSSHTLAMRLLSEGRPEVSAYALDEPTGVMRRGRFDWLGPSTITDYKSCASSDPRDLAGRWGAVQRMGYSNQAAWYLDLARDLNHPAAAFAFIFQSKEAPYLVTVAYIDEDDLADARAQNRRALELFRDCTASGVWPGYVADDSAAVLSLTQQTYEVEQVIQ